MVVVVMCDSGLCSGRHFIPLLDNASWGMTVNEGERDATKRFSLLIQITILQLSFAKI